LGKNQLTTKKKAKKLTQTHQLDEFKQQNKVTSAHQKENSARESVLKKKKRENENPISTSIPYCLRDRCQSLSSVILHLF
jgi:hypothetical protein